MNLRWGSKRLTYVSVAVLLVWIVGVTVLIAREPDPGASSPTALAADLSRAVSTNDTRTAARLIAGDPGGAELLLRVAGCGTQIEAFENQLKIFQFGTQCASLPIAQHDDRWYIDPAAPTN